MITTIPPRETANRRLHLLDIDNLQGRPRPSRTEAKSLATLYRDTVAVGPWDQLVVATNHGALLSVGLAWPGARLLVASGPDGADLALQAVVANEAVVERFSEVVLGSGDGIFACTVGQLAAEGCQTTIVSRRESLSKALLLAAQCVVILPDEPLGPTMSAQSRAVEKVA